MKKIRKILILFFLLLLIFSVYRFSSVLVDYREGRDSYAALTQYISFGSLPESTQETGVPIAETTPSPVHAASAAAAQSTAEPTSTPQESETAAPTSADPDETPFATIVTEVSPEANIPMETNISVPTHTPNASHAPDISVAPAASLSPTEAPTDWPEVDFARLRSINPDVVAWIYIEGTHINYPVVQAEDNKHYLKRMFDGKRNAAGCIFLDYRCEADFSGLHSILYGHHMKDDSMFADLVLYKDQAFYDEHPVALLITPTRKYKIQLFSSYVANNRDDSWQLSFGQQEFESWLRDKIKRFAFKAASNPDGDESILTLSTCTYDYDGAKYILHGYVAEIIENDS